MIMKCEVCGYESTPSKLHTVFISECNCRMMVCTNYVFSYIDVIDELDGIRI